MSLHIGAAAGAIAPIVFITGDPLRAKHFAYTSLTDVVCFNELRAMYGFTGLHQGQLVSIMGTGIGMPSTALYVHELVHTYQVKTIIRLGTTGAIQRNITLGEIIVATKADSDSSAVGQVNPHGSNTASQKLLSQVAQAASDLNVVIQTGIVFSTDLFYRDDDATRWVLPAQSGVLSVDMETAMLYALGKRHGIDCLSILTVSDNIISGLVSSPQQREKEMITMLSLALTCAEQQAIS